MEWDYQAMVGRVRAFVAGEVPRAATVLVVSDGDDALTRLDGREGWHFPRSAEGWHAGRHPADDEGAIAHLEELRALGATWIAFPVTAFWWLDHYAGFHRHLARRYTAVQGVHDDCLLFRLDVRPDREVNSDPPPASPPIGEPAVVSVVIPCYKQAHFLARAIESVLGQTYPAVELIVIDDGSPDGAREVVESFPALKYIRQENKGQSAARNRGLGESRGAYLVFLDADDMLLPASLAASLQTLYVNGPDFALVSGHYRWVGPDDEVAAVYLPDRVDADHYEALLRLNYIGPPGCVLFRRWAVEEIGGFDEDLPACEDYELYLRIARRFPVCRHYELVADYRRHESNISADPALMLRTVLRVLESQREFVGGDPVLTLALAAGLSRYGEMYGSELAQAAAGRARRPVDNEPSS